MPCYDGREDTENDALRKRLDEATRAACTLGRMLLSADPDSLVTQADLSQAIKWYAKHSADDKRASV